MLGSAFEHRKFKIYNQLHFCQMYYLSWLVVLDDDVISKYYYCVKNNVLNNFNIISVRQVLGLLRN